MRQTSSSPKSHRNSFPPEAAPHSAFRNPQSAFTLVEMIVSIAVLVLVMVFIAQMMNSTTISTTLSGRHVDTDGEARLVFDRMAMDFARMSRRTDVDFIFSKEPEPDNLVTDTTAHGSVSGTDATMFFYSEAPAFAPSVTSGSDSSTVALIGYSINTTGSAAIGLPAFCLERLAKGLSLNSTTGQTGDSDATDVPSMVFLTSTGLGGLPIPSSTLAGTQSAVTGTNDTDPAYQPTDTTDYDLLSPEVIRMDFCFQVKDLTYLTNSAVPPGTAYSSFPIAYFQKSATNTTTISTDPPSTSRVQSTSSHPFVGDRYYDIQNNRAYVCTGFTSVPLTATTSGTIPIWTPNGLGDVKAIVVSIAIMDQTSRNLLKSFPDADSYLSTLSSALLTPTEAALNPKESNNPDGAPLLMADLWQSELLNTLLPQLQADNPTLAGIASHLRIYQRFFYLNTN